MINGRLIFLAAFLFICGCAAETGDMSFTEAAKANKVEKVGDYLAKGVNIETPDENGQTALLVAAIDGNFNMVKLLADAGANVNVADDAGLTPLMYAVARKNEFEMEKYLISRGADVNARDSQGQTALMQAAYNGNFFSASYLLSHGAQLNIFDNDGISSLMYACVKNYPKLIEILISHGANVNQVEGAHGWTPLMLTAKYGNKKVVEMLVKYGADINKADAGGKTAAIYAVEGMHNDISAYLTGLAAA